MPCEKGDGVLGIALVGPGKEHLEIIGHFRTQVIAIVINLTNANESGFGQACNWELPRSYSPAASFSNVQYPIRHSKNTFSGPPVGKSECQHCDASKEAEQNDATPAKQGQCTRRRSYYVDAHYREDAQTR